MAGKLYDSCVINTALFLVYNMIYLSVSKSFNSSQIERYLIS